MRGDRSAMTAEQVSECSASSASVHQVPQRAHVLRLQTACHGVPDNPALPASDDGAQNTYAFRTASLRNLTFTAPYSHNGMFRTLVDVVGFYEDTRGGRARNPNVSSEELDPLVRELGKWKPTTWS